MHILYMVETSEMVKFHNSFPVGRREGWREEGREGGRELQFCSY